MTRKQAVSHSNMRGRGPAVEPPLDVQRVEPELTAPCFFCGARGPCKHGNKHRVH